MIRRAIDQGVLGSFESPNSHTKPYRQRTWCADNGCFSDKYVGDEGYLRWLRTAQKDASRCIFATAPDVLCDAETTLKRSMPMFPRIREIGFPVALVAQNGLENISIPWDDFDVLFLGGDTRWKLGAAAAGITQTAISMGKHVHMGRVNGLRRLRYAKSIGCRSVDGTFLAYSPNTNFSHLLRWLKEVNEPSGVVCVICETNFFPVRNDARTCGTRCRKQLSRAQIRQASLKRDV